MAGSGVKMSEKRMSPSGLNECHGWSVISTIKSVVSDLCRGGGDQEATSVMSGRKFATNTRAPSTHFRYDPRGGTLDPIGHTSRNDGCFFASSRYAAW